MELNEKITAQKMKLSIEGFFSKCDQICSFNPKKSLMENFIFCAVNTSESWQVSIFSEQQRTWNTIAIFFLILHHGPMSLSEVALSCNCKWAIGQKQINNGSAIVRRERCKCENTWRRIRLLQLLHHFIPKFHYFKGFFLVIVSRKRF